MSKQNGQQPDYLTSFIINAGKVEFETSDGRKWLMRQPTSEEAANGNSAYRLAYQRVLDDDRLRGLAEDEEALKRESRIRGTGAEVAYMLPLLLEDERGPVFDVYSATSMARFEEMDPAIVAEMTTVYLGPLSQAIEEAKKKSRLNSSTDSKSASNSDNGHSPHH